MAVVEASSSSSEKAAAAAAAAADTAGLKTNKTKTARFKSSFWSSSSFLSSLSLSLPFPLSLLSYSQSQAAASHTHTCVRGEERKKKKGEVSYYNNCVAFSNRERRGSSKKAITYRLRFVAVSGDP